MDQLGPPKTAPMRGPANRWTTLLVGCWGFLAAYQGMHALLISHDLRPCIASLVPLLIVWAAFERKRWGRMALLGFSLTVLITFLVGILIQSPPAWSWLAPEERSAGRALAWTLRLFADEELDAVLLLALAAATGYWLRRPAVVAEFERGKQKALVAGQRAIALLLICAWSFNLALPHHMGRHRPHRTPQRTNPQTGVSGKRSSNSRIIRSAAPARSL